MSSFTISVCCAIFSTSMYCQNVLSVSVKLTLDSGNVGKEEEEDNGVSSFSLLLVSSCFDVIKRKDTVLACTIYVHLISVAGYDLFSVMFQVKSSSNTNANSDTNNTDEYQKGILVLARNFFNTFVTQGTDHTLNKLESEST